MRRNMGFVTIKQINNNIGTSAGLGFKPIQRDAVKNNIEIITPSIKEMKGSGISIGDANEQVSKINFAGNGVDIHGLNKNSSAKSSELYGEVPYAKPRGSGKLPCEDLKHKLLMKLYKNKK